MFGEIEACCLHPHVSVKDTIFNPLTLDPRYTSLPNIRQGELLTTCPDAQAMGGSRAASVKINSNRPCDERRFVVSNGLEPLYHLRFEMAHETVNPFLGLARYSPNTRTLLLGIPFTSPFRCSFPLHHRTANLHWTADAALADRFCTNKS